MITIIASIIGLGLLIFVHELGHFLAAKKIGVMVEKFSFGFGPEIIGFTKGETRYCISALPFGGYVKLAGERGADQKPMPWELTARSAWEKIIEYLSGPIFNFILAFVLFAVVLMMGVPTFDMESSVIGKVTEGYPAQISGLTQGDQVISVNGEKINSWIEVQGNIRKGIEQPIEIKVLRNNKEMTFKIISKWDKQEMRKVVGIGPKETIKKFSFFESISEGFMNTVMITYSIVKGLVLMITGKVKADIGGPVLIVQMMGMQAQQGLSSFLYFIGFLSVNFFIINLVPLPIFDGGMIVLICIEAIRGRSLSRKTEEIIGTIGIMLLVFLMVFVTYKDIIRFPQVSEWLKAMKK